MRKPIDTLRMGLAGVIGTVATVGAAYLLARFGHVAWVDPVAFVGRIQHARLSDALWLAPLCLLPFVLAGVFATWFDGLLRGPAAARGLKFGLIVSLWVAAIALLVHQASAMSLNVGAALEGAKGLFALLCAYGLAAGTVYGAGRERDEYRHGIGYGVPDRRSIA